MNFVVVVSKVAACVTPAGYGPGMDATPIWVPFASAFVGAVVGGASSLFASIFVDRLRLRREMRFRIYDDYIAEAAAAVARWELRSRQGNIDLEQNTALLALAQVRRAAVIAGKTDLKQIKEWEGAYLALCDLSREIAALPATGSGAVDPKERARILPQVAAHAEDVMKGLGAYLQWLEKRLT